MEYSTSDIILAAVLRLKGYQLLDIQIVGSRGNFIFKDVSQQVVNDFDKAACLVEPVQFNNTIKQLTTACRRKAK